MATPILTTIIFYHLKSDSHQWVGTHVKNADPQIDDSIENFLGSSLNTGWGKYDV